MKRALLVLSFAFGVGCGQGFGITTPKGFANLSEVEDQNPYDYRATSAEGVVLAVRRMAREPRDAEPSFWMEAVENELRLRGGYALLDKREVSAKNGTRGLRLRFGHDEDGKPYVYEVTLYVGKEHLVLVESGGRKDAYDKHEPALRASLDALDLRD